MEEYRFTTHIDDAKQVVSREYDILERERQALNRFKRRVTQLSCDTSSAAPTSFSPVQNTVSEQNTATSTTDVREAYKETVMDTPHYTEEYGDTVAESIVEELGTDAATVLTSDQPLLPPVKNGVLEQAERSCEQRERVQQAVEAEKQYLRDAANTLQYVEDAIYHDDWFCDYAVADILRGELDIHISSAYDMYKAAQDAVEDNLTTCEELCDDRQHALRNRDHGPINDPDDDLNAYLYQDMDVEFPVLADVATTARDVTHLHHAADQQLFNADM